MQILNVEITTASKKEILNQIAVAIASRKKFVIFTPNPEIIVAASRNASFQKLLNTARVNLADGVGLKIAYFLRHPFSKIPFSVIHGIDFMMNLCGEAEKHGWSVGLLGGMNGAAEKTRDALLRRFPRLKVEYIWGDFEYQPQKMDPYGFPADSYGLSKPESNSLIRRNPLAIRGNQSVDIIFVALGTPKEEYWINEHKLDFPATVFMQVGGAFDIVGGVLPRAPRLWQHLGLEWLWRLILQPKRLSRQLRLFEFMSRCLLS